MQPRPPVIKLAHVVVVLPILVAIRGAAVAEPAAVTAPSAPTRPGPSVLDTLVAELFLGRNPLHFGEFDVDPLMPTEEMTHVSPRDVDMVLELAPQPVSFWLELGAFEGGSAILVAQRAKLRGSASAAGPERTAVVAVDTFLGDVRVLWERPPEERQKLLRPDGTVSLYDHFRANVRRAGHADTVLPLPATSVVALHLIARMARRGTVPQPQVIYLDSAHEEGEVLLELQLAWEAVAPGGILFGDDWVLPENMGEASAGSGGGGAVQRDVLRFAEAHQGELDDELGPRAQPLRTLGRARPGLFVSYLSFQWFMRKLPGGAPGPAPAGHYGAPARAAPEAAPAGFDCWSGGYEAGDCCDEQRFGPGGNLKCWDIVFTFEQCCRGWSRRH
mmetsp:Transcript_5851/g.16637  ORF Transcript_5851/g.16637 Transcript_5851/m.16637 type:complete len:388 (-) Transcript_5851:212-1375(-)